MDRQKMEKYFLFIQVTNLQSPDSYRGKKPHLWLKAKSIKSQKCQQGQQQSEWPVIGALKWICVYHLPKPFNHKSASGKCSFSFVCFGFILLIQHQRMYEKACSCPSGHVYKVVIVVNQIQIIAVYHFFKKKPTLYQEVQYEFYYMSNAIYK